MKDLLIAATLVGVAYLVYRQFEKDNKKKEDCPCKKKTEVKEAQPDVNAVDKAVQSAQTNSMNVTGRAKPNHIFDLFGTNYNATEHATFAPPSTLIVG